MSWLDSASGLVRALMSFLFFFFFHLAASVRVVNEFYFLHTYLYPYYMMSTPIV